MLTLLVAHAAHAQEASVNLPDILRHVPPDAAAVVVIPDLKRASDDLTRLLEGMDRANLLLGGRPIDQVKSITGYNAAINDNGAAALMFPNEQLHMAEALWLVPCDDPKFFLEANFSGKADDGSAYRRGDGSTAHARTLESHVLIGSAGEAVNVYAPGAGMLAPLQQALRGRDIPAIADANVMIILRKPALAYWRQRALAEASNRGAALAAVAALAARLSADLDTLIITLQGDPLALVARCVAIFEDASTFGAHAPQEPPADASLARLPASNDPFLLALNIDLAAMGGDAMLRDLAAALGEDPAASPVWLKLLRSMQLSIKPSPAGVGAGLLNGAGAVLASDAPADLRAAIRQAMLESAQPPQREVKWIDAQPLADGGAADAYEVRSSDAPANAAALEALLFGAAGMRGYVRQAGDGIVLTFAQRPALLDEHCQSANAAATDPAGGFARQATVKVMRRWMWAQRDIEGYLNVGQALAMFSEIADSLGAGDLALPQIDASAPPIGFALDVAARRADGVMIVPAAVLSPIVDELMRMRPNAEPLQDGN